MNLSNWYEWNSPLGKYGLMQTKKSDQTAHTHTCDKFEKGVREIFFSFQGGLSKMYRKILNLDQGDLRNEFHFSEVCQRVNYTGSRAKWMNPKVVHVNFASDPV